MNKPKEHSIWICMALILTVIFMAANIAYAADEKDMQGWGVNDPYNKYYDVREFEKFRGWVVKLTEVVPMPGMSPATVVIVRDGNELVEVHLCPTWFAKPSEIGVKKGDRVKLKGAWAEVDGKDIFMASKIKKGEYFEFKVRLTKDGTPFWSMSEEQLAYERAESQKSLGKQ